MSRDKDYSIISVHSDDAESEENSQKEDEIVIQAGVPHLSSSAEAEKLAAGKNQQDAYQETPSSVVPTKNNEEKAPNNKEDAKAKKQVVAQKTSDEYRETTQEDLEADGPMRKTRIIILIVAVLILVAAPFYFTFFFANKNI